MAEIEWTGVKEFESNVQKAAAELKRTIEQAIDKGADEFVGLAKAVCPTSELEAHPGELKDSIHKEDGRKPMSRVVVADAKDEKGRLYGAHVEWGHRTVNGKHVAAQPFFYTSWRVVRKRIKARITRARNAAVKTMAGSLGDAP